MRIYELIENVEAIQKAATDHPFGGDITVLVDINKESFIYVCNCVINLLYKIKEINHDI